MRLSVRRGYLQPCFSTASFLMLPPTRSGPSWCDTLKPYIHLTDILNLPPPFIYFVSILVECVHEIFSNMSQNKDSGASSYLSRGNHQHPPKKRTKGRHTKGSFHLPFITFINRSETAASSFQQACNLTAGYGTPWQKICVHFLYRDLLTHINKAGNSYRNKFKKKKANFLILFWVYMTGQRKQNKENKISALQCKFMRQALNRRTV